MKKNIYLKQIDKKSISYYFNLIELMVVILVIAIIAAFLLSSLSRAREYAVQTACANNLHQIALAHQTYKADYKSFPRPNRWLDDFRPVYPYIKSYKVFTCPGKYPRTKLTNIEDLNGKTDYYVFTYGDFKDYELNDNTNNGHGNNESAYDFDPGNHKFERIAADKLTTRLIYDRFGPAHFKTINVAYIDEGRTGSMTDMCFLWTLDKQDTIFLDAVTPWPSQQ